MIYLWKLNGEELELNLSEILKYKELEKVYTRDKMAGKMLAKAEFRYIDFLANRDSYCIKNGLSELEAKKFAIANSRLPDNYVPDKITQAAITKARELNGGVIEDLIDATVSAFRVDAKMMIKIKQLLEQEGVKVADVQGVEAIMKMTDAVIKMSSTIPNKINQLLELREAYEKKLKEGTNEKRGGGEISNSYDGSGIERYADDGDIEKLD